VGEAYYDEAGTSVSLSDDGSTVAIGAPQNDSTGGGLSNVGHVRVFEWSGSSWSQKGADIDGEGGGDRSGHSVSLSSDGSIVAIGGTHNDGTDNAAGHVRVYEYSDSSWSQKGADIDGEASTDLSGSSVSLSSDGTVVAIGATQNNDADTNAGQVRVYEWNSETSAWGQKGADIDGEADSDFSGWSVSVSDDGDVVAIGAAYNSAAGWVAGHVRVYEYKTITETEYDNGNTANTTGAVGVPVIIDGGESWGASTKFWVQQGDDIDAEAIGDLSGSSVSLSSDGNLVAIGAPSNDADGLNRGHVRVYQPGTSFVDTSIVNNNGLLIAADRSRSQVPASTNKGSLILDSTLSTPRLYYSNGTDWASFQDQTNILDYISTVTPAADKFVYFDSSSTAASGTVTSFMRDLLASGDQSGAQVHLGVDPIGTVDASGMAISGWADSTIIGTGNALINKIDASGTAVSGWTQGSFGSFLVNNNDDTIGGTLSADGYIVANNGYIGSVTTTDAIQLASNGAVTVKKAIKEAIQPNTASSIVTLDMDVANFHTISLNYNANHNIQVSNVALGQRFVLRLKQHSYTGNGTVSWGFSNINWCDGAPPTIGSAANHITLIGFVKVGASEYDGILIAADLHL
jgi:hypothetical protein